MQEERKCIATAKFGNAVLLYQYKSICIGTTALAAATAWQQGLYGKFAFWSYPLASLVDFSCRFIAGMS